MIFPDENCQTLGFHLKQGTPGVYVSNVTPGSAADIAGVEKGDFLLEINDIAVNELDLTNIASILKQSFEHSKVQKSVLDIKVRRIKK